MTHDPARQRRLNEQAAAWLLQLEDDPSPERRTRFHHWLEQSADHVRVFLETTATYRDLDLLPACGIDVEALARDVALENGANIIPLPTRQQTSTARPRRVWRRVAGLAAVVAAGALLYGLSSLGQDTSNYQTRTGEQRSIKLDDGSVMHLNTRSRVKVRFSPHERSIELLAGEALFTVTQDRLRPFRVRTDRAVVQAIGTEFNVYRRDGQTTVSVVEGAVQVSTGVSKVSTGATARQLQSGEEAQVDQAGHIVKRSGLEASRTLAWRQRKLDFNHAPLAQVVAEFNRYNEVQIRIEDPKLGERLLNGVFNADEPQALLRFLGRERELSVRQVDHELIIQTGAPQGY